MFTGILSAKTNGQLFAMRAHRDAIASLLARNIPYAGLGDAGGLLGSAVAGSLWVSLHTRVMLPSAVQTTNEINYPGYARMQALRDPVSDHFWAVIAGTPSTTAPNHLLFPAFTSSIGTTPVVWYPFPACGATGSTFVVTHVGFGTDETGDGKLIGYVPVLRPIPISQNSPGVICGISLELY